MFAVPGWKIATQIPVQEPGKPVKQKPRQDSLSQDNPSGNTKKRKRDRGSQQQGSATTKSPEKPQVSANSHTIEYKPNKKLKCLDSRTSAKLPNPGVHAADWKAVITRTEPGKRIPRSESVTKANHDPVEGAYRPIVRSKGQDRQGKHDTSKNFAPSFAATNEPRSNVDSRIPVPALSASPLGSATLTPLQAKMRAKLTSARFRYINETLYTTSSSDAMQLFTHSPDLFADYHAGFSQQVKDSWPQNPVDLYVLDLKQRGSLASPSNGLLPLPRRKHGVCHIADLGCGDAPLARALQPVKTKLNLKFVSFDLHAPNEHVTKADISALPLGDGEADVAIFCLSLMGTNWLSFVEEAWRVLRGDGKGEVWISEVKSRFSRLSAKQGYRKVVANSVGKRQKSQFRGNKSRTEGEEEYEENPTVVEDEGERSALGIDDDTNLEPFINAFLRRGFALREGSIDKSNKMFVNMIFAKVGLPRAGKWKGVKWNGKAYERINSRRPGETTFTQRFDGGQNATNEDDESNGEDEGKLLKPCVYKLR